MMLSSVIESRPSVDMHHVISIQDDPSRRMDPHNWLALCRECHSEIEGDVMQGIAIRQWSDANYVNKLNEGLG